MQVPFYYSTGVSRVQDKDSHVVDDKTPASSEWVDVGVDMDVVVWMSVGAWLE